MPKGLSLKKVTTVPSKNQKPITLFFKNTGSCDKDDESGKKKSKFEESNGPKISNKRAISMTNLVTDDTSEHVGEQMDDNHVMGARKKSRSEIVISNINCNGSNTQVEHLVKGSIPRKQSNCNLQLSPDGFLSSSSVERSPLTPIHNNVTESDSVFMQGLEMGSKLKKSPKHKENNMGCSLGPQSHAQNKSLTPEKCLLPKLQQSPKPKHLWTPEKITVQQSPSKTGSTVKALDLSHFVVGDMFDDDWDDEEVNLAAEVCEENLDLSVMQRCEVLNVKRHPNYLELQLKDACNNKGTCFVEGIWSDTPMSTGDIVSVLADRDSSNQFRVTNSSGLLVLRPDHLLSSTSVVAGVFCKRKALLQERWRGIDSANTAMTIGILIHELVQKALTHRLVTVELLRSEAQKIIEESIQMLYDAGLSEEEARTNIQNYVQPLADFMQTYMTDGKSSSKQGRDKWSGHIEKVLDIEENVCCPQLGLKGKIDATLQVTIHDRNGRQNAVVPLELKSGKASVSAEHRGQLVLYGMMMSIQRRGNPATDVQKGLLLYLKDRVDLREVSCGYPERRDLMMLRNQLVQYLAAGPMDTDTEQLIDIEDASRLLQMKLPEPVNHPTACAKCPYLTLCSLHLWNMDSTVVSESHPLVKLRDQALGHLTSDHVKYFMKWTALLKMEERGQLMTSPLHSLWTDSVEKREKRGSCAPNLKLKSVKESDGRYLHVFENQIKHVKIGNKATKGPQGGDFSIVSIDNRPWIAAGVITLIKDNEYHILLERDLSKRLKNDTLFHIDMYESYATVVQNLTNLGVLMEDSDRAERLRKLIIDKVSPEFEKKLPREVGRLGAKMMRSLNIEQQRAILKTLAAKDYALLQGLPGTGKTQTISVLIQMLVGMKLRVLVTAHTHSAVDTVLRRLPQHLRVMRLGSASRVAPDLEARTELRLTANCETPAQLEQLYDSMEVVGVTCLGAAHALLARTAFDICIVDEATQVLQCTVLRPLFAAKRFVLVGDPEQLPPVVRSRAARRLGMEESLFHRLSCSEATSTLQMQYRMNQRLVGVANKVAYNSKLKCADQKVAEATINIDVQKLSKLYEAEWPWLFKACSPDPEHTALFLDMFHEAITNGVDQDNKVFTNTNPDEACVVLALIDALKIVGMQSSDIGVIAPYRDQVSLLRRALQSFGPEVSTVDQFQGRDKSVIIYSCTRRDDNTAEKKVKEGEILNDQRRLAVSVTRAKHKLILVGNSRALCRYEPLQRLIDACTMLPLTTDNIKNVYDKYSTLVT